MKSTELHPIHFTRFLVTLCLVLIVMPLVRGLPVIDFLADSIFTIMLLTGIWSLSRYRWTVAIAVLLITPKLCNIWLPSTLNPTWLKTGGDFGALLFFSLLIYQTLRFIFRTRQVNWNAISAAIIAYLLLGIGWALIYSLIEQTVPGSFSALKGTAQTELPFIYFSFVTLTTLGYGDITPLNHIGATFAMLEALVGQMYLAIMIARLVGMHIAAETSQDKPGH